MTVLLFVFWGRGSGHRLQARFGSHIVDFHGSRRARRVCHQGFGVVENHILTAAQTGNWAGFFFAFGWGQGRIPNVQAIVSFLPAVAVIAQGFVVTGRIYPVAVFADSPNVVGLRFAAPEPMPPCTRVNIPNAHAEPACIVWVGVFGLARKV